MPDVRPKLPEMLTASNALLLIMRLVTGTSWHEQIFVNVPIQVHSEIRKAGLTQEPCGRVISVIHNVPSKGCTIDIYRRTFLIGVLKELRVVVVYNCK